jgi:hypothetical protein
MKDHREEKGLCGKEQAFFINKHNPQLFAHPHFHPAPCQNFPSRPRMPRMATNSFPNLVILPDLHGQNVKLYAEPLTDVSTPQPYSS